MNIATRRSPKFAHRSSGRRRASPWETGAGFPRNEIEQTFAADQSRSAGLPLQITLQCIPYRAVHPERAVPVMRPALPEQDDVRRNVILLRECGPRSSLGESWRSGTYEIGCRFGDVSLLVDLRDRVRLVDL